MSIALAAETELTFATRGSITGYPALSASTVLTFGQSANLAAFSLTPDSSSSLTFGTPPESVLAVTAAPTETLSFG